MSEKPRNVLWNGDEINQTVKRTVSQTAYWRSLMREKPVVNSRFLSRNTTLDDFGPKCPLPCYTQQSTNQLFTTRHTERCIIRWARIIKLHHDSNKNMPPYIRSSLWQMLGISTIPSQLNSARNLQHCWYNISHRSLNMSLSYFEKYVY